MPFVFWGTLDVLSLVSVAHLLVKVSHFHPPIRSLSAHPSQHSARNGLLPDLSVNLFWRSVQNGILPDLSVNLFWHFSTERHSL